MTAALQADVVVVGGGPAGAATAWALARNGVDVLVVDAAHFPRAKPCAEYLGPPATRVLSEMGALERIYGARAVPITGMTVHAPSGKQFHGRFADGPERDNLPTSGVAIQREQLDPILLDRARAVGARVLEGVAVRDLARNTTGRVVGVRVRDADAPVHGDASDASDASMLRTIEARIVVGADGFGSVVARQLGSSARAPQPRRIAFVAHCHGVSDMGDSRELHLFADGYCELVPVGGGMTSITIVVPATPAHTAADPHAFCTHWLAAHPRVGSRCQRTELPSTLRVAGPFAAHGTRTHRAWAPGACLVGDATESCAPVIGTGIHTALRGGAILGPYLCEALRAPSPARADHALEAYERSRQYEFGTRRLVERLLGSALTVPALMDRVARSLSERHDLADLWVRVVDGIVPVSAALRPGLLWQLFAPPNGRQDLV